MRSPSARGVAPLVGKGETWQRPPARSTACGVMLCAPPTPPHTQLSTVVGLDVTAPNCHRHRGHLAVPNPLPPPAAPNPRCGQLLPEAARRGLCAGPVSGAGASANGAKCSKRVSDVTNEMSPHPLLLLRGVTTSVLPCRRVRQDLCRRIMLYSEITRLQSWLISDTQFHGVVSSKTPWPRAEEA